MPGQGAGSSVFPPVFVFAPAFEQFPQFTGDNKWKPDKINNFNGSGSKMTAFVFRFCCYRKAKNHLTKSGHYFHRRNFRLVPG